MYRTRLRREASLDIDEQAAFYEGEQRRLGVRYIRAVFDHLDVVASYPTKHREEFGQVRVALVPQFPFGVFFIIDDAEVIVLAVLDLRRSVRRRLEMLRRRLTEERQT